MGIIRLLLAIAVLIDHAGPLFGFRLVSGPMAVEAFFMISGFYMTLVLNEKYIGANSSYGLFISQRLLRLYPIYWVVLGLTILVSGALYWGQGYSMKFESYLAAQYLAPATWSVFIISNLVIVGQDILMFLGLDHATGELYWTTNFRTSHPAVYEFLFVHQAWSLGIEIMFYLIAPFLMRRKTIVLVVLTILSLGLRICLYRLGLKNDPWSYRFFPCELAFFFIGGLAYRAYDYLKNKVISTVILRSALWSVVGFTLIYQFLPAKHVVEIAYYLVFAIALPFNFILTKTNHTDCRIGELSYPVYISHLLILLLIYFAKTRIQLNQNTITLCLLVFTVLFSMLLVRYVAEPIERIRQHRIKKRKVALVAV